MKRFICKTLGFLAIFAMIVLALYMANRWFCNFRIDGGKHILVIGNSHPECAFNDALIPEAVNFSESGDAYYYTYLKAKKFIDANPHIDKILIEISTSQIQRYMDSWIWEEMYLGYRFPKYAPIMDRESLGLLLKHNPRCVVETIPVMSKTNANMLIRYRLDYKKVIGGHLALDKCRVDSLLADTVLMKTLAEEKPLELSAENLGYLDKLIAYSRRKGVEVFLIRSPVHEKYPGFRDEPFFREVLASRYADIEFIDFSRVRFPNDEYADLDHLNSKGADRFSRWFAALLDKGLLERTDKQAFVDAEAEALSVCPSASL